MTAVCLSASQLLQPLQRLLLPHIPHRAFVTVQAVASGRQLNIFRRHVVRLQDVVKHVDIVT